MHASSGGVYGETLDMGMHVGVTGPASHGWIQATNTGNLAVNYNLALNPNGGAVGIGTTSPDAKLDVNGAVTIGDGTLAINADAYLTLRNGSAFVGIDLKSARTSGNIGGLRYYGTASDSIAVAQFLVLTDGTYNFLNGSNGAENRFTIANTGNIG